MGGENVVNTRIFVSEGLDLCTTTKSCTTFESGALASRSIFELQTMEVRRFYYSHHHYYYHHYYYYHYYDYYPHSSFTPFVWFVCCFRVKGVGCRR